MHSAHSLHQVSKAPNSRHWCTHRAPTVKPFSNTSQKQVVFCNVYFPNMCCVNLLFLHPGQKIIKKEKKLKKKIKSLTNPKSSFTITPHICTCGHQQRASPSTLEKPYCCWDSLDLVRKTLIKFYSFKRRQTGQLQCFLICKI